MDDSFLALHLKRLLLRREFCGAGGRKRDQRGWQYAHHDRDLRYRYRVGSSRELTLIITI